MRRSGTPRLVGGGAHLRRQLEPLRHHETGDVRGEEAPQDVDRALARQRPQVAHLGVAEHLDPLAVEVLGEAGQHQPRLLDPGGADAAREPLLARDEGEPEVELLVVEEGPDADRVHRGRV